MSGGSLTERLIDVTFTLGSGTFAESGTNTVTLSDHRVGVRIQKAGGPSKNMTDVSIFGMSLSLMNRLSTLGLVIQKLPRHLITVQAGGPRPLSVVFKGTVIDAAADFQGAPTVPFRVRAQAGAIEAVAPAAAQSFPGKQKISAIMGQIASAMGLPLENNLRAQDDVQLTDQNLPGTAYEQMRRAAAAAHIGADIDDNVLVIYPLTGPRTGDPITIAPGSGMVGYPIYISQGLMVRTLFNPAIRFHSLVQIQNSIIAQANGTWLVSGIDHALDSKLPGGQWFSDLYLYDANPATPAPILL